MSLQMEARRPDRFDKKRPVSANSRTPEHNPLWPKPMVSVRVLTKEEQRQQAEEWENRERLPELSTSAARMVLSMVGPWDKHDDEMGYGGADCCGEVSHKTFVQAHERLAYTTTHLKSQWDKDVFDRARDFIRECALNGYEATYG